ncbi:alpha-2-macroglobulin family protein [Actibacterium sp. 188UL27-1]|uniref:alpha-2-macroglobulin family protein n=1 Tax=Actibacterium sp. 188UL27-1 TaxID=2786961 RepID=UPI00195E451F|nr:alpha-2-macroglobulin family protein [Actibacterium sp. 188UL27-1]MBM7067106.1 alpha-2-macroglobulin family protein [Actibacterium sp. 188UL27-1]
MRQILLGLLCLGAFPLWAQTTPVPEKRVAVTRDVDFYGADLRNIFDTTLEACEKACLSDANCKAFTFNTRSNACFPKSDVTRQEPYQGAISAQIIATQPAILQSADQRADELNFLSAADLERARAFAVGMGRRHQPGVATVEDMVRSASQARDEKRHLDALRWTGAVISRTDLANHWLDYATDASNHARSNQQKRREFRNRAVHAAINGYLRSDTPEIQGRLLTTLAGALEVAGRGRDMIPALKLAQTIAPSATTDARLDDAIGKYGFRITEHRVESDAANPRICVVLSEDLDKALDYTPYIRLPGQQFAVTATQREICVAGLNHGTRYNLTFRAGLPSAAGDGLAKDIALNLYVRDRAQSVRFPGRAYVLPRSLDAALPIVTVNTDEVDLTMRRVSERNVLRVMQDGFFGRPLAAYQEQQFSGNLAEQVWSGTGETGNDLNADVTTRLPLGDVITDLPAGLYALQARVPGADPYDKPAATQWFVISDLGVATMAGTDGLHVFVRSLGSAEPRAGLTVTLLSRANREIATATTDDRGYAVFGSALTLGEGSAAPGLLTVADGTEDIVFLSMTDPEFDLSDRGVEGRAPSGPIDLFLATDRGAYRAGETIYATALVRDNRADALVGVPLTAVLTRPDGVEYSRHVSTDDKAGGHVFALPIAGAAPRGTWTLRTYTDPDAAPLATRQILVEDFLPERIDVDLSLPEGTLRVGDTPPLGVDVQYLFGAPGAGLKVEGDLLLQQAAGLDGFPGYRFGRHDESFPPRLEVLGLATTNDKGAATLAVQLPQISAIRPFEARMTVRVAEGSGRPVERSITRTLAPAQPLIGIRPAFDGTLPGGGEAAFTLIGVGADGAPRDMRVKWQVNRIETRYQWYSNSGRWNWEPTTTRTRITNGEAQVGQPVEVTAGLDWGSYELVVERIDGPYTASSVGFSAGWYAAADAASTPDTLELSLDKTRYAPGDTAQLRLVPRYAGKALVTVMSDRLIDMTTVEVAEGENLIDLSVTDDWGAGVYVTATVIRPMDVAAGRNPARALGLQYAGVEAPDKRLDVTFDVLPEAQPRQPLDVALKVDGVQPGETAYVTLAAVDVGILNLTGFEPPDAVGHYLGQRRLGMGLRDIYGRLIDGMNGAMGAVRSGGDATRGMGTQAPPPTEELLAYFTGPLTVGADGMARASFELPAFNGTVKLMAVAWSDTATGNADTEVLVRDPVVVTASLPRFLAPGDQSRILLEIVHADGPAGDMALTVAGSGLMARPVSETVTLAERGKATLEVPITANRAGLYTSDIMLTTPDGKVLTKTVTVPVQLNDPEVARTSRFKLAAGDTFTLSKDIFADMHPGTGTATLALGPMGTFDAPGLLQSLDSYPYGCTEQTTSRAMPLLYMDQVATAMGLGDRDDLKTRIDRSVTRVLARQSTSGGFGLWRARSGDFWLDAYVTDFLSRARAQGYTVPDVAFTAAVDNLSNRVNYAPDFGGEARGGEDIAYALMVLAREGKAAMGDLRYYADVKRRDFPTPLASAQLGAALALYGDQRRADAMFAQAGAQLAQRMGDETRQLWRSDYGTNLRDAAAVLTLATEAGSTALNTDALITRVSSPGRVRSTQEQVWTLLAANALIDAAPTGGFTINGAPVEGPLVPVLRDQTDTAPLDIRNGSATEATLTLTTFGVPTIPEPKGGNGYAIDRTYFTTQGEPVDPSAVPAGTRLVTVLSITPFAASEARLMVNDPLPAGFEIDNPSLLRSGDLKGFDWLETAPTRHSEFRQDRFLTAIDWRSDKPFKLAYVVRAISAGDYHHPAASVEDMYRPQYRAQTDTGRVTITP